MSIFGYTLASCKLFNLSKDIIFDEKFSCLKDTDGSLFVDI